MDEMNATKKQVQQLSYNGAYPIPTPVVQFEAKPTQGGGHTDVVRFLHQRGANLTRVDRKDIQCILVSP